MSLSRSSACHGGAGVARAGACAPRRCSWLGVAGPRCDRLPPPLATLTRGRSYVFELVNTTPHTHPIHLHGHTFQVIDSNKRKVAPYFSDTVLIHTRERVKIAFVADNPGDWMLHCHIIEHQDTGMMGYVRVA